MNLPMLLDALDAAGVENPIVCSNINKIGFRMSGGIDGYLDAHGASGRSAPSRCRCSPVGRSRRVRRSSGCCGLPNLESIVFGASSRRQHRLDGGLGRRVLARQEPDRAPTDLGRALRVLIADPAADLYGSDRMMMETATGLAEQGCEVLVVCGSNGPAAAELVSRGIEVLVGLVPVIRKSLMSPRGLLVLAREALTALPRLIRLLRVRRPDVVLANTVTIPIWSVAARLAGVPVVVHVHEAEQSVGRAARLALSGPLVIVNSVVFNSATSRAALGSALLDRVADVRVISNGVAGPTEIEPARPTLDPPLRVVFIGRLSPRKAPDLVVEALRELDHRGVSATLTLVGDVFPGYEWYEQELRASIAGTPLVDRVRFVGFQPSVWSFLAEADVAVVPSRLDESFGNTLVEAVLAGRPAVAADHTGLREIGAELASVELVANDDSSAIADALARIADEWTRYRVAASDDARRLRDQIGPERYHADVHRALAAAAGS